jgi:hypothetical protein
MSFNLVLDEPAQGDMQEEHVGLNFIVEAGLYEEFGTFTVTSVKYGEQTFLQIDAAKQPPSDGCSSCSSCG